MKAARNALEAEFDGIEIQTANGLASIAEGQATAIAFGRPWIANPDLPLRYKLNAPLNEADEAK